MKPKPFWLLNHFTVPLFMGVLPLGTCVMKPRRTQPVSSRFGGEARQSGALFAARPSRSAETRLVTNNHRNLSTHAPANHGCFDAAARIHAFPGPRYSIDIGTE